MTTSEMIMELRAKKPEITLISLFIQQFSLVFHGLRGLKAVVILKNVVRHLFEVPVRLRSA
jgi:hypothetical protein